MDYALTFSVDGNSITRPLHSGRNTIGRLAPASEIILNIEGVSREHATINVSMDNIRIVDLKSKNGTFVNGKRVEQRVLQAGDMIALGPVKLRFDTENTDPTFHFSEPSWLDSASLTWVFDSLLELGAFLVNDEDTTAVYDLCLQQVARLFHVRRACLVVLSDGINQHMGQAILGSQAFKADVFLPGLSLGSC